MGINCYEIRQNILINQEALFKVIQTNTDIHETIS
jgi:hypothetical protein